MMLVGTTTTHVEIHVIEAWTKLKSLLLRQAGIMACWRLNEGASVWEDDVSPDEAVEHWVTVREASAMEIALVKHIAGLEAIAQFKTADFWSKG